MGLCYLRDRAKNQLVQHAYFMQNSKQRGVILNLLKRVYHHNDIQLVKMSNTDAHAYRRHASFVLSRHNINYITLILLLTTISRYSCSPYVALDCYISRTKLFYLKIK